MAYLQLADPPDRPIEQNYVRIPNGSGGTLLVREDYFDKFPDRDFNEIMDYLDGVGLGDGLNDKAARQARRKNRKDRNEEKKQGRIDRKNIKADSKATAREQRTAGGGVLSKIGGIAKDIIGGITGGGGGGGGGDADTSMETRSGVDPNEVLDLLRKKKEEPEKIPLYEQPWFWPAVGGVVLVGGYLIYTSSKNK